MGNMANSEINEYQVSRLYGAARAAEMDALKAFSGLMDPTG
jgi:hypothetical protein